MKIPVFYSSSEEILGGVAVTYDNGDTMEYPPYKYTFAGGSEDDNGGEVI